MTKDSQTLATVNLTVNGESRSFTGPLTVDALLRELQLTGKPCAVEVNGELIPRRDHGDRSLRENDAVEVVTLVGGG